MSEHETTAVESQEPDRQPIRWLHICEAGIDDFAAAVFLTGSMANTPNLPEGDADLFKRASERMARVLMQEVGRRAFEDAVDAAEDRYHDIASHARRIASADDRWKAAVASGEIT